MRLLVLAAAAGGLAAAFLVPLREGGSAVTEAIRMPAYEASTTVSVHPAPGRPESSPEPSDQVVSVPAPAPQAPPRPAAPVPIAPSAPPAQAPRLAPARLAPPVLVRRKPVERPEPIRVLAQQPQRPDDRPRRHFIPE